AVAGVPPDYFSTTGQRWGNPLYRWHDKNTGLSRETVSWWAQRIRHLTGLVDSIRIDHFRGFESYWSVPAHEETAMNGTWEKGPGLEFFQQLRDELGDLPLIAEDLGDITPAVTQLREKLGLPGMKILQFAFDGNTGNSYLPHTYADPHCVVYTGTHDNNTTRGWFYGDEIDDAARQYILEYLGAASPEDIHWQLIRLAFRSVAELVILPAQDILGEEAELRMNLPGTAENNWRWKLRGGKITDALMQQLRRMAYLYDRAAMNKNTYGEFYDEHIR
ncbi:MAG: 4-alpha-glucanotransferase, partial [Pseudomonadota bacterium]